MSRRRRGSGSLTHPAGYGLLLVSPALLFVLVFVLFPLAFAIYISLTNWPLIGDYHFVGWDNYANIPEDATFLSSVRYTFAYTAIVTLPILVLGYALAVLVRGNRRGSTLIRTAVFLPYVIGLTTLSFVALLELQPNSGAVNAVLAGLGLTDGSTAWLVDTTLATVAVSVLVVWGVAGFTMVLLLGGMQGIPPDVYESADIDGAGWWSKELRITLPLLRRTIALSLIISIIGSFLAFNQFFILTQGGPGVSTTTVVLWIYRRAFVELQLGAATSLSLVLVVVVALVTALQFWLLRERD